MSAFVVALGLLPCASILIRSINKWLALVGAITFLVVAGGAYYVWASMANIG
jgi:hypothetical protein